MRRGTAILVFLFCLASLPLAAQPAMLVLDGSASMWGRSGERKAGEAEQEH